MGIGGFVSAVAFMLFFWSKFLHGTAGWLEVLLFLGGVCFLLLEVLVLPGFGIFGLGGGAMILASLVLASQTISCCRRPNRSWPNCAFADDRGGGDGMRGGGGAGAAPLFAADARCSARCC